jgi:mannose-6-phosphate isomerase
MEIPQGVFKLVGRVQYYAWGGFKFIPELLRQSNPGHKPFAEYWLGAHPAQSSMIPNGGSLAEIIDKDPVRYLGAHIAKKFASLPFLFKVLDVREMLSIQVHPAIDGAQKGFDEEEQKGVARNAGNRNYKDRNHKPEIMVALSDFWLLHGFKNERLLHQTLDSVPELRFLKKTFEEKGYKGLYSEVMMMEQSSANKVLEPLIQRILPAYKKNELTKDLPDFWAAKASESFCRNNNFDRGIFSIYFFNLLHIEKGSGIFQPAGLPHAYLEGQNMELMANSDNVLRAGLTEKHIDVPELMKHVIFEPTEPRILRGNEVGSSKVFRGDAQEFELIEYRLKAGEQENIRFDGPAILFQLEGKIIITAGNGSMHLEHGESVFIAAGTGLSLQATTTVHLFVATVPAA